MVRRPDQATCQSALSTDGVRIDGDPARPHGDFTLGSADQSVVSARCGGSTNVQPVSDGRGFSMTLLLAGKDYRTVNVTLHLL